ncbi:phosphotransferase family enzyme [Isoptericola sp. CG 20/1183]|uniref:Phosphotransferase family enzyme n=1 Tax=Isoptericola halotolerans TaxID=300560 RepID=A0ABX5EI26_9MICO|nr:MULTISPECIES: aminoglycoside phosphotransferase family protein [Isoptericola]PRZ09332.1 phosphotransferase family enzyme [Isoptericola sp. CG 20/1183]PRZ10133.1 phosphotransferase family enzyme [Isoptericola halotolerans]
MLTKTAVTDDQVAAVLAPVGTVRDVEPLAGGLFATVLRVGLADGRDVVVKVTGADTTRLLRYEHGISGTEAAVYRLAHRAGLPVPAVLHVDASRQHVDGDVVVTEHLAGVLWNGADLDDGAARAVRRSLGAVMARLHRITGDRFGYPAPSAGLSRETWPEAFGAMVEAVLADADRWDVPLPHGRLRAAVRAGHEVLAAVTTPRLVHADLWPGNVLLDPADHRLTAFLDAERALWGDPVFELVGADQLGAGAVDPELLAGYRETGGELGLGDGTPGAGDPSAWTRLRLYRAYFACLLVVEVVPRAYTGDWVEGYAATARGNLERMLDELEAP